MNTSGSNEKDVAESAIGEIVKTVIGSGAAGTSGGTGTAHAEGLLDDIGGIVNAVGGAIGSVVGGGTVGGVVGAVGDVAGGLIGGGSSNNPHYHNAYPPGTTPPTTSGGNSSFLDNVVGGIGGAIGIGGIAGAVGGVLGSDSGSHYHSASPVGGSTNVPSVPSVFGGIATGHTGTPPTGHAGTAPGTGTPPPVGHAGTPPGGYTGTPPGGIPGGTGTISTPMTSHNGSSFTVGGAASGGAGPSSIILEPGQMFQTLQQMENATQDLLKLIHEVTEILEAVSILTFAVGFGELIKMSEAAINQVGSAVVAANNAFNSACKEVVNQLVQKFAPEGAKSDYSSPAFIEITIKINLADRAQVEPSQMKAHFDNHQQKNAQLSNKTNDMRDIYRNTSSFWIGHSADKTRSSFESKIVPRFEELLSTLNKIVEQGFSWVEETLRFEASLGV